MHVWQVDGEAWAGVWAALADLLTAEERARAERIVIAQARERFVAARGLLRLLLGHYLDAVPAALTIAYSRFGKPYLADAPDLQFNLSHTGDCILYAFARNRRLGIDVETVRADLDIAALARHIFSPHEQHAFFALPPEAQQVAFFDGWTRKEAYVKAQGLGFSLPLQSFDVSLQPDQAALLATQDDPAEAARWRLTALDVGAGYRAALAVEGQGWTLVRQPVSPVG